MMKQSQSNETNPQSTESAQAQQIAREFARIGKLTEGGKVNEAWSAANALYARYPKDPTANFVMALLLKDNKQSGDALAFAQTAVKLAPENPRYLVFLGKLYVDLALIEFASDLLHKAFALDKTMFQAPWALARYYLKSGQGSRALPYFDLALQAAPPGSESEIRLDRATCLLNMGNTAEAEADFEWARKNPKLRIPALVRLALLKKNDHASDYASEIRLELERQDLNVKQRSRLLLSLGRLYENGRDFDKAFLYFEKSRQMLASKFDREDFHATLEDAVKFITPDVFRKFREFGHDSKKPIFVVGMPRSGTTLTEQIIAAHSQAAGVGELIRMPRLAETLSDGRGMQQVLDKMAGLGPEKWKDVPQRYLNLLNALAPDAHRAVDKLPHNFLYLGFIHLCFPNAKIIHCTRNPLDNFISAFQNEMNSNHGYVYDQVAYGDYYLDYRRLMNHWTAVMPHCIYQSQYEALTKNPEAEIRKILNFLGLPWEEACLRFNERESTVSTMSRLQVRNPINNHSVSRWRNYERHLGPIIDVFEKAGFGAGPGV